MYDLPQVILIGLASAVLTLAADTAYLIYLDKRRQKRRDMADEERTATITSMYHQPGLYGQSYPYWFRMRDAETNMGLKALSLREYAHQKTCDNLQSRGTS